MNHKWIVYKCECGQRFAVEEEIGNEIEEPCCPACWDDELDAIGYIDVTFRQPVMVE